MVNREAIYGLGESRAAKDEVVQGLRTAGEVNAQRLSDLGSIPEDRWPSILETLNDRNSLFGIDWSAPFDNDTESTLNRLASLKATHPEDNITVKKLWHNKSVENYIKLALEAAGDSSNLRIFLELVRNQLVTDPASTVLAEQTFLIWSPAAEIAGWSELKTELEEAAFERLYPDDKQAIVDTYAHLGGDEALAEMIKQYEEGIAYILKGELDPETNVTVQGRRKSYYSVWRKATKRGHTDYTLPDYLAMRAIADSEQEGQNIDACYSIRDTLVQCFTSELDRYKDYIKNPQPNGYQSIHLTISDINGALIEFQIKTAAMHNKMEMDLTTAHMIYDAAKKITPGTYYEHDRTKPLSIYTWRSGAAQQIRQRQNEGNESLRDLRPKNVVVFAYDGNLYELGKGDTVLDFALAAIHTDFGLSVQSIFVNGLPAKFDQLLKSGQVIKVNTHKDGKATWNDDWMIKINSTEAKRRLRRVQNTRDQKQLVAKAGDLLEKEFRQRGLQNVLASLSSDDKAAVARKFGDSMSFELVLRGMGVGYQGFGVTKIANRIERQLKTKEPSPASTPETRVAVERLGKSAIESTFTDRKGQVWEVAILGTLGCEHRIAGCCSAMNVGDLAVAVYSYDVHRKFSLHYPDCTNIGNRHTLACTWHQIGEVA